MAQNKMFFSTKVEFGGKEVALKVKFSFPGYFFRKSKKHESRQRQEGQGQVRVRVRVRVRG